MLFLKGFAMTPPKHDPIEDHNGEPFSDRERKILREMMRREDRVQWFWATVRVWALWFTAVATAFAIFKDTIRALFLGKVG